MPLLTSLLILIVAARLLGPSALNLIHANAALASISEFAVFLVVLSAGLEMNFKDVFTALPVTVRILQNFNLLNSEIARYSVAARCLLVLGVLLNLPEQPSLRAIAVSVFGTGWVGGLLIPMPPTQTLVIASIAYERGFINQGLFSTLVLMGVVTTMITPPMDTA